MCHMLVKLVGYTTYSGLVLQHFIICFYQNERMQQSLASIYSSEENLLLLLRDVHPLYSFASPGRQG